MKVLSVSLGGIRRGVDVLGRSSSRAVLATGAVNTLISVTGSMGGILLARGLGPTGRGNLVTVLQWPAIIAVLTSLGVTTATCYLVARDRPHASSITATAVICSTSIGFLVAASGALLLVPLIARSPEVRVGMTVDFLIAPAFILGGVFTSALQGLDVRAWNVARLVQPITYLLVVFTLWLAGSLSLLLAIGAYMTSVVAQAVVGGSLASTRLGARGHFSWIHARELYSYGPKVTFSSLPQIVNIQFDLLVLSVLPSITPARLANYAVAVSMAALALPVAVAAGYVAFPVVASSTSEATRRRVERKSIVFAAMAAAGGTILVAITAPIAIPRVFGVGYGAAVRCLWVLGPGMVCLAVTQVVGEILRGRGRPLLVSIAEGVGAVVTLGALSVLVPRFGILGAAATSSVAYAIVLTILLRCLRSVRRNGMALVLV